MIYIEAFRDGETAVKTRAQAVTVKLTHILVHRDGEEDEYLTHEKYDYFIICELES